MMTGRLPFQKGAIARLPKSEVAMVRIPSIRNKRIAQKNMELRKQLWPAVTNEMLWIRTERDGFATIPRTIPYFLQIMNDLSKGKPVAETYLALWCRARDEGFVVLNSEKELAYESDFHSSRATNTWQDRMKTLRELGFIDSKKGPKGPWNYVLLLNPYQAVQNLREQGKVSDEAWNALFARAQEISATDLDKLPSKSAAAAA